MDIKEISDIQSESGVVGTLVYHPDYILHTDYLFPNYFYGVENGCLYWAIQELYREGISNKLQSHKGVVRAMEKYNLPAVQEYMELYKQAARHTLEEYQMLANNIVTCAFKRDLVKVSNEVVSDCFKSQLSLDQLSNFVYSKLDGLTQKYISNAEVQTLGESIDDVWNEICSRRTENGMYGIPSKYPLLNEYFTYETGELAMLQARYKQGKSVFLLNEVVHKLRNNVPSLVIDTEMQTRLYVERLISHITGIEIKRIKSGNYSKEEDTRIKTCIAWIKDQPFVHIYDPQMTYEKMYSICKMLKYKMGLTFFCYDYLKSNESDTGKNYNILGEKCDFLKNRIAGELDLAVLSACQLGRQGDVADSDKINRHISVGIKWGIKNERMRIQDNAEANCGNAYAKVYVNRNGEQVLEDDEQAYIDFEFIGSTMTINQAKNQHYIPF